MYYFMLASSSSGQNRPLKWPWLFGPTKLDLFQVNIDLRDDFAHEQHATGEMTSPLKFHHFSLHQAGRKARCFTLPWWPWLRGSIVLIFVMNELGQNERRRNYLHYAIFTLVIFAVQPRFSISRFGKCLPAAWFILKYEPNHNLNQNKTPLF